MEARRSSRQRSKEPKEADDSIAASSEDPSGAHAIAPLMQTIDELKRQCFILQADVRRLEGGSSFVQFAADEAATTSATPQGRADDEDLDWCPPEFQSGFLDAEHAAKKAQASLGDLAVALDAQCKAFALESAQVRQSLHGIRQTLLTLQSSNEATQPRTPTVHERLAKLTSPKASTRSLKLRGGNGSMGRWG